LLGRIKDEGGEELYQGAALKNFSPAIQEQDALPGLNKMREHLKWSNTKLLCMVVTMVANFIHDSDDKNNIDEDCSLAEVRESVEHRG